MKFPVFTYGSLMFDPVWQRVVQGRYASLPAHVEGFRRLCVRDEHYPALVASRRKDRVTGRLYLDVSEDDLLRLDRFEGTDYVRLSIPAHLEDGRFLIAETYLATPAMRLLDLDWDPEVFAQHGLAAFMAGYLARHEGDAPPSSA